LDASRKEIYKPAWLNRGCRRSSCAARKDGGDARPQNKRAAFRLDLAKPKRPVMDLQRQRAEPEENLPAAQEKSPVRPGKHLFPV
jgi:hypothetical protein